MRACYRAFVGLGSEVHCTLHTAMTAHLLTTRLSEHSHHICNIHGTTQEQCSHMQGLLLYCRYTGIGDMQ